MTKQTHTPGPWHAVQYLRSAAWRVTTTPEPHDPSGDICNVVFGMAGKTPDVCEANAKLIAEAPNLLKAAEEFVNSFSEHADRCRACTVAWQNLRAAIAAARGEK